MRRSRRRRTVEGARVSVQRVDASRRRFEIRGVRGARVEVMGDFTDWTPVRSSRSATYGGSSGRSRRDCIALHCASMAANGSRPRTFRTRRMILVELLGLLQFLKLATDD